MCISLFVPVMISDLYFFSGYSDVVRTSYMNGEDEDPFAMDTTVIDDNHDKSPPDYNSGNSFFHCTDVNT